MNFSLGRRPAATPSRFARRGGSWWLPTALLLGAVALSCGEETETPSSEIPVQTVSVRTIRMKAEAVTDSSRLPADLLALRRAVLAAEVQGRVERVLVEEGQKVKVGATVARIDTEGLRQQVAEAEALNRRAEARHQRATNLFEKRSITQQQLLDAVTDRDVAHARLASARLQLGKSSLRMPWTGEIARRQVEVGDYVVPGQGVVEILDRSSLKVRAPAPAADAPFLAVGAPVSLRLQGVPQAITGGRIVRLAPELDPATRTLEVEAEIPNPDGTLRPGLFGELEVVRRQLPEAFLVPLKALLDLGGGEDGLFVVEDGFARRRIVELGPVLGDRVVVTSGLGLGDEVIVAGSGLLGEGQPVTASLGQEPSPQENPILEGNSEADSAEGRP